MQKTQIAAILFGLGIFNLQGCGAVCGPEADRLACVTTAITPMATSADMEVICTGMKAVMECVEAACCDETVEETMELLMGGVSGTYADAQVAALASAELAGCTDVVGPC